MALTKQTIFKTIGILGTILSVIAFLLRPSFPTPDKLILFLMFVFMSFSQAIELLKRLGAFVIILLAYESFRSVADKINKHVNYLLAPNFDRHIFGNLPTVTLQKLWWHGHVQWYDYLFYLAYMLHFVLPIGLAIIVWKTREKYYWRLLFTYLTVSFGAFATFLIFPAAPPWLASQNHFIEPITRVSSYVWAGLGLQDFPSFYNHISPNPVAAIPSLHSAWATLLLIFTGKLYDKKWLIIAAVYPLLIYVGTIYEGDHYAFDVLLGIIYALIGYWLAPKIILAIKKLPLYKKFHLI